ncbi:MAG TPA: kelch repeat-containing protein [Sandaracinaceae bacterium LLY-WYZ-13_1]|nr:kelch repeat-containing protein [Sandaracinaceae bacterium LLY-WYZ-13_1]
MVRSPTVLFLAAAMLTACAPDERVARLRIEPPEALGCQPNELTSLRIVPLGDFPAPQRPSVTLDPAAGVQSIERFPEQTVQVAVTAEGLVRMGDRTVPWMGGGVATLVDGEVPVPVLRLRRACALSDPEARAPEGSVLLGLADGRLLVAGGHDTTGAVLETVTLIQPGDRLAETGRLRLFNPRTGATGTELPGGRVLVAGGTAAVDGAPFDNLEILRVTAGEEARLEEALLARRRRDHGAALLPDGRVLLLGGRDSTGAPIRDAELVTVEDEADVSTRLTAGAPLAARASPAVRVLDDGTVLVLGGVDAEGPVDTVERFDPASEAFEAVAELPAREGAAHVAVAGARAMQLGGRDPDGAWVATAEVLLDGGATVVTLEDALVPTDAAPGEAVIEAPAAVGLPDGRVLVVGRDSRDRTDTARVIDPGSTRDAVEAAREPVNPSRVAPRLVRLADGAIAEVDADGVSLLRLDLLTRFTDPDASLFPAQIDQRAELAFDAPGRWAATGGVLSARRDGARFDVPASRFADVRIELEVRGDVALLLTRDRAPPRVVSLADRVALGDCGVERASDAIIVERVGDRLTLGAGDARTDCALDVDGRVGVAIRASEGSGVRSLSIARLAPR